MKKFFIILLITFFTFNCAKSKKSDNKGLLAFLLLSLNSSSNPFSAAVPTTFAVSSVTEQLSTTTSILKAVGDDLGAEDFKTKKQNMEGAMGATNVGDCFKAIPKALRQEAGSVSCYGPRLSFTSHSQINNNSMPGGDLGIWQTTEGSNSEACAAAKANSLIRLVSNRVDFALGTAAAMGCIAKISNLTLPSTAGSSLDLASSFKTNSSGKGFTVTTAKMSRLQDSNGKPQFQTEFVGSRTNTPPGGGVTITSTMDITIKQLPNSSSDTKNYKGLIQMTMTDSGGIFDKIRGISIVYERSGTSLTYSVIATDFPSGTAKTDIFDSTTGEIKKASSSAGGKWDRDFNNLITTINDDGIGKMAYGWQAGIGDGYLRVFNAETKSDNTGTAYFGFSQNANNAGTYSLKPSGMFCAWTSQQRALVTKLQKQTLSYSSGVWKSSANNITFAPTNDCNHASSGAVYSGLSSNPSLTSSVTAAGAVTNDLVNASDNTITLPTAPSYP